MGQAALDFDAFQEDQQPAQPTNPESILQEAEQVQIEEEESAPSKSKGKGRPRSEKSRKNILKATNSLLLHMSVQELSIEAVAKKAKVGKTTIYRWWDSKASLVMDALISQPGLAAPLPTPKNNADAVVMQLEKLIRMLDSKNGETIAQLFSEAQASDEARAIFKKSLLTPLMDAIEYSLEQGKADKEFRSSLDTKSAVDMLCGPIFFRLMAHPEDLNESFRETYPKEALRIISA